MLRIRSSAVGVLTLGIRGARGGAIRGVDRLRFGRSGFQLGPPRPHRILGHAVRAR
ncbi:MULTISPECIES: hypothetical protein [unclassified Nocardia]|uniref:hypothetical protein n=1 Tax=unclassified Nocardia TaxID=2637762 RepID=UPI00278C10E2|nr:MULTISPECIES: hypothetical protein [unclassified Nocardia]